MPSGSTRSPDNITLRSIGQGKKAPPSAYVFIRGIQSFTSRHFFVSVPTGDAVYNPPMPVPDVVVIYDARGELVASRASSGQVHVASSAAMPLIGLTLAIANSSCRRVADTNCRMVLLRDFQ